MYQWISRSRHVFAVHRLVHFQWNQRRPKHPWFREKNTSICLPLLSELFDIMIWAMSECSASFETTMNHATMRFSSDIDIDVKRPDNHQVIVSTKFNFNIPQEWPININVVKTKLYTKWEKTFALTFCYTCHHGMRRGKRRPPFDVTLWRENTSYNRENL